MCVSVCVCLSLCVSLSLTRPDCPDCSYRIRKLSEEELAVKVSKDVKRLRNFEEGLLSNYQVCC